MRSRVNAVFAPLAVWGLALALPAAACPAFIAGGQLGPAPAGTRADLRLFTIAAERAGRRVWVSQPLQVDPMEAGLGGEGVLAVPQAGQRADLEPLAALDRIAVRVETFGLVRRASDPAPCKTAKIFELQDPLAPERFAYLAACDDPQGATRWSGPDPVKLTSEQLNIKSAVFDYTYLANNQLLFAKLGVRDPRSGANLNAGEDADILLHLDLTKFFTLDLTNDNVQSFVETTRSGPVGLVERLQFFLKLFVFKIDLKMATTASFFADSANLPMVMDIPVDPAENLNKGSGMLFNWRGKAGKLLPNAAGTTALAAQAKKLAAGPKALAKDGLAACRPGAATCVYSIEGAIADRPFFIDMIVPRYLVEAGFYPLYVGDVAKFKDEAGIGRDDGDAQRVAVYFEVSGLPKGQHKMDYWIRLGAGGGACPAPVSVRSLGEDRSFR